MRFSYKKFVIIACIFACTLGMLPSCQASRRTDTTFLYFDTVTTVNATGLSQKEFDAFAEDSVIGDLQMQSQTDGKWLSALVEEEQKRLQKP